MKFLLFYPLSSYFFLHILHSTPPIHSPKSFTPPYHLETPPNLHIPCLTNPPTSLHFPETPPTHPPCLPSSLPHTPQSLPRPSSHSFALHYLPPTPTHTLLSQSLLCPSSHSVAPSTLSPLPVLPLLPPPLAHLTQVVKDGSRKSLGAAGPFGDT
ncbi:hypothetical protein E2C01_102789 [Portunus trituberculatus]|uniref:Uncharacterized protein n=1 Tax=Portunus trituberculatus TaxID=210409 RepID=A0A5B7KDH5_PORTR|nr:hypothetical protein [Portunus trituberculatus]